MSMAVGYVVVIVMERVVYPFRGKDIGSFVRFITVLGKHKKINQSSLEKKRKRGQIFYLDSLMF